MRAPEQEQERLAALRRYAILDTESEACFDDLARLSAAVCKAPIAFISFIDEGRQWVKSAIGLGVREVNLGASLCVHAIETPELFVIPDLAADPRFAQNPLVAKAPKLRFYAAAPLVTADGHALGTLCVFDFAPRDLHNWQKDALATLARQIISLLELRLSVVSRAKQDSLVTSEQRFRLATKATNDAIWDWDLTTNDVWWNDALHTLFGYKPEEVEPTAKWWYEHIHPEDRERVVKGIHEVIDGDAENWSDEYRYLRRDGSTCYVFDRGYVLRDEQGKPLRMLGAMLDLSERKAHERELRDMAERFRFLAEHMPQKIFTARPDGLIDYFNRQWSEFTGLALEQIEGWGWTQFVHPDDLAANVTRWAHCLKTGEPFESEHRFRRSDGEFRWHLSRAHAMRDETGKISMWVGSNTDIHELKEAQEALIEADRKKDQFLATLSHELRNPLAPIANALALWPLLEKDSDELRKLREMMGRQVQQLSRLIDDLLDVSRISRGKIQLRRQTTDIGTLIGGAVEAMRPFIEMSGHELNITLPHEPIPLDGDVARLMQVFGNLLHNAVKYTPRGGILWVSAERDRNDVVVRVRDNGSGIPEPMLPRIFDMFTQVDQTLERSKGGLGIGLTLVKSLVELHGGSVKAESQGLGRGAELIVRLPVLPATEKSSRAKETSAWIGKLDGRRVLIVDDVEASATTLVMMLQALGHQARSEFSGAAAIPAVREFRPDAVFLDIAMPGMNGYTVARKLREEHGPQFPVLIALTGFGQEEDRRRAFAAGFDHHIVKPASLDAIEAVLAAVPRYAAGA
jgi:PAS domain S-box-containing protein